MSDIELRRASPGDRDDILDLMRLSLGEGGIPRSVAYWRWKHEENPFGASPCLLAIVDGELVGLRVFMRWMWRVSGREVPAMRAVDTATHPVWRGQGIFSRLTLRLLEVVEEEGVAMIFNTPNEKSRPGYLKMGWDTVGRVSLWIRPMRPLRIVSAVRRGELSDDPIDAEGGAPAVGRDPASLFEDPNLEAFLERVEHAEERLATPRKSEYLKWRYAKIPGIAYRAAWSMDGASGAIVFFRMRNRGQMSELRFCDIIVGPGSSSRSAARSLIRELSRESDADFASAMTVSGGGVMRVLGTTGFVPAPRLGPIMTVRQMSAKPPGLDPLRRSAWHLSIGDLELF